MYSCLWYALFQSIVTYYLNKIQTMWLLFPLHQDRLKIYSAKSVFSYGNNPGQPVERGSNVLFFMKPPSGYG